MIIEDSLEKGYLQGIECGEVFRYNDKLYMRLHAFKDSNGKDRTAVDIHTGSLESISLVAIVGKVKAKVVLE